MISRDQDHIYRNEKDEIYLSCTQHLQIAGLVDFSMVRPEDLNHARDRGLHVHAATKLYLNNDLDLCDPMEGYRGYVEAFIKFCLEHNINAWDAESLLWSDRLKTAGEFDFVSDFKGLQSPTLFEIKTTSVMPLTTPIQIAAYITLWNERKTQMIVRGCGIHLKNNGKYSLYEYNPAKYAPWFQSIVRCNWNALSEGIIPTPAKSDQKIFNLCQEIIG